MEKNPIIPKPLKRYKGTIILAFTWFDLAFLACFAIIIILLWAFISMSYWIKFFVTIFLIAIPVFLTLPINDRKGYIEIYRFLKYCFSKKIYSRQNLELLNPYQEITTDGLIKLKTGSYILPIELTGFNIAILQEQEQLGRINSFRSFIRSFGKNFSIIKCTLPNSLIEQENLLLARQKVSKNKKYQKAIEINLDVLASLQERELNYVDKYFILLYGSKENIAESKNRVFNQLKMTYLEPQQASKLTAKQIINSYYGLEQNQSIKNLKKVKFHSNYIKMGSKYLRIYAITGFPMYAYIGWLETLNFGPKYNWNIKVEPFDQSKATKKIDRAIKSLEIEQISAKKASQNVQKDTYLGALNELNNLVHANGEILNSTYTFIKIEANSWQELNDLSGDLISEFKGKNISYSALQNLQKEGFESILPKPTLTTRNITSLELPSISLAYGFPFSAEHLKDPQGIYLGYTNSNSNIYFDIFHQNTYRTNSNAIILGTSGSGKSTTSMKLIKDQLLLGRKVIAIDPEREYKKLCEKLDGNWINFGSDKLTSESETIINPLQFFKNESGERELLSSHIQFLEQFFQTLFPDLKLMELNVLREIIIMVYQDFHITSTNSHLKLTAKQFPTIAVIAKKIITMRQKAKATRKIILENLELYFSVFKNKDAPEYKLWEGHTNFNLHVANFLVMDTHTLGESGNKRLSNAQLFLLLKFVNSMMIQNKFLKEQKNKIAKKMMIVIDEAHLLIDEKQPFGLDFMYQMVKRARKYDAMTLITTQNVKDFVGGSREIQKKTGAIINTSQYSFLLGMNPGDIEDLDTLYQSVNGLTELEKETLSTAQQGSGILAIGPKQRKIIQVDLSNEELALLAH